MLLFTKENIPKKDKEVNNSRFCEVKCHCYKYRFHFLLYDLKITGLNISLC